MRHRRPQVAPDQGAQQSMLAFAGVSSEGDDLRPKRTKSFGVAPAQRRKAAAEMQEMARTGDWTQATGRHLVALYASMHERVYGVPAVELDASGEYALAAKMANAMVHAHFAADVPAMVEFMKWTWRREADREKWRRENRKSGGRIGWRLQFGPALLTDHRIDTRRR